MIKIENTDVYGFEAAIRGMRNPMNSWDKSDSKHINAYQIETRDLFVIGEADKSLMMQLVKTGSDHSKFMRMINVTCDITAPLYWWKEMDTYKVGTVRNSCSTMHRIHAKEFELNDFSHEHLITEYQKNDNEYFVYVPTLFTFKATIEQLNFCRGKYLETKDKVYWWQMIQLLPSSYNQRATWQANYAVLRNIYHARKSHKLNEWHDFCTWIKSDLPYSELITEDEND